nr:MAG TPA: hypothetical protein [Caudoviricetes sp.]
MLFKPNCKLRECFHFPTRRSYIFNILRYT